MHYNKLCSLLLLSTLLGGQPARAADSELPNLDLPMQEAESGNFYVQGILDGTVETSLLVDTGSGYVMLSRNTFNKIKRDAGTVYKRSISGTLANGRSMSVPVYQIRELRFAEDCVLRELEVAVLPGADRDILGMSALRQMQPLTFQMQPPRLIATSCG